MAQRRGFRDYLQGLLLPRDRNKTLTGLAGAEPITGAQHREVQRLQWFLSESAWDHEQANENGNAGQGQCQEPHTEHCAHRRGSIERVMLNRGRLPRGRRGWNPEHPRLPSLCRGESRQVRQALASQRWHVVGSTDRVRADVQDPDRSLFQSQRPVEADAPHE